MRCEMNYRPTYIIKLLHTLKVKNRYDLHIYKLELFMNVKKNCHRQYEIDKFLIVS